MAATAVVGQARPGRRASSCYACAGHPWPLSTCTADGDGRAAAGRPRRPARLPARAAVPRGRRRRSSPARRCCSTPTGSRSGAARTWTRRSSGCASPPARTRARRSRELLDRAVAESGADRAGRRRRARRHALHRRAGARRLRFPAELEQVPIARHAIRDWLAELGVAAFPAGDVLLAARRGGRQRRRALRARAASSSSSPARRPGPGVDPDRRPRRRPLEGPRRQPAPRPRLRADARRSWTSAPSSAATTGTVVRLTRRVELGPLAPEPMGQAAGCSVSIDPDGHAVLAGELDLSNADGGQARAVRRRPARPSTSAPSPTWTPRARACSSRSRPARPSSPRRAPPPRRTLDVVLARRRARPQDGACVTGQRSG